MHPRDDDRVRTIPISDGDDDATRIHTQRPRTGSQLRARAVPLLTLLLGIVLAGSALSGFTSIGSDDPIEEADEANREGRHLGPDDQLLVVAEATGEGWSVTWNRLQLPSSTTGSIGMIPSPSSPEAASRALDASGAVLADHVCEQGSCTVVLTSADDPLARVTAIEGNGFVWHASMPLRLAWIQDDVGVPTIHTGTLDVEAGRIDEANATFPVDDRDQLLRWDDAGFILSGTGTRAIGPTGSVLWEIDGEVFDTTQAIVTLSDRTGTWSIVDRVRGTPVMAPSSTSAAISVMAAPAGHRDATVGVDGYRYSLSLPVEGDEPDVPRPVWRLPIGSTPGGQYRIYRNHDGSRLTLRVQQPLDALGFAPQPDGVLAPSG
jgi:hypothetical protein